MAYRKLGDVAVGTVVKLREDGVAKDHLVVHQGLPSSIYDASCDGVWVLNQDCVDKMYWNSSKSNVLETSKILEWLKNTMLGKYDANIQNVIKQVKIPYRQNGGAGGKTQTGANGLACKVFLLSGYEVGFTADDNQYYPVDGAKLSYFEGGTGTSAKGKRVAQIGGASINWWLRSPFTSNDTGVINVESDGNDGVAISYQYSYGVRPAFILPKDLLVDDDGNVLTAPQAPNLVVPSNAMVGQPIPVSWTASDGADSYTLQRKADSGEWETIYTGANLQYQDTAGSWSTVQYQVAASIDGLMGDYAQSAVIPVISASALVISGSDEDLGVITRDIPYTVTSDTGNEITLVRTVNGQQVASRTVQSGFSYNIPVLDLPTGKGTIEISASVQASSGPVTTVRKWQYEKTALQWPSAGGVGQLTQNEKNVFPLTLVEAVRTAGGVGLDKILEQLMPLIGNVPKFMKGSYVGTGTSNVSLSAPGELLAVMVRTGAGTNNVTFPTTIMIKPTSDDGETVMGTFSGATSAGSMFLIPITWNGSEVSWTQAGGASDLVNSNSALNKKGVIYDYLLLYK